MLSTVRLKKVWRVTGSHWDQPSTGPKGPKRKAKELSIQVCGGFGLSMAFNGFHGRQSSVVFFQCQEGDPSYRQLPSVFFCTEGTE